jgi:hypothetical protein
MLCETAFINVPCATHTVINVRSAHGHQSVTNQVDSARGSGRLSRRAWRVTCKLIRGGVANSARAARAVRCVSIHLRGESSVSRLPSHTAVGLTPHGSPTVTTRLGLDAIAIPRMVENGARRANATQTHADLFTLEQLDG